MENLSIFLKILILGESNVGKTSILTRFLTGNYDPDLEPSLGTDYHIKLFKEYATKLKIQFWDINESDIHQMNFLENVAGIVMVCNFERDISIGKILDWKRDITNHVEKKIPIVLVANKIDYYDGDFDKIKKVEKCLEEIAFQNGFLCSFLVSAKDNLNINELFFNVINFCIEGNKNLI